MSITLQLVDLRDEIRAFERSYRAWPLPASTSKPLHPSCEPIREED
jgi:hypothetical protein